ncbi:unnamed protein product [Closterium sp. NIES-53]
MQVYGADYDETYSPVSSYFMLRIFLGIVAILDLNLMQLDMKNASLQSKLDRVLYMCHPDYYDDGTGRGPRQCDAGSWLEEEPGRHGALLQGQRRRSDLLGAGLQSLELIGYVDADDAGDKQNRTSTSDYVFVFGGAAVYWSSQRIKCVTLSSTESAYVATTDAGKEGRQIRFLLA